MPNLYPREAGYRTQTSKKAAVKATQHMRSRVPRVILIFLDKGPMTVQEAAASMPEYRESYVQPRCSELRTIRLLVPVGQTTNDETKMPADRLRLCLTAEAILLDCLDEAETEDDLLYACWAIREDYLLAYEREPKRRNSWES